jgi:thiol-disulfide isomerase/thioredoxin
MPIARLASILPLLVLLGCKPKTKAVQAEVAFIREKADIEKVQLTDLDGRSIDLGQYKGKAVFLNFWATWCKPCLREMPSIQQAQQILQKDNVVFLLASDESVEQIKEFKTSHDFPFTYVKVENTPDLNIMSLPTTFIYNPAGKLMYSDMGYRKWDDLQQLDLLRTIIISK